MQNTAQRDYWPTREWRTKTLQEVGVNADRLAQLHEYAQSIETLYSVLKNYVRESWT